LDRHTCYCLFLVSKLRTLIAVVDDEEPVRIALRRLLRSAGVDVETFPSGAEFLESLKAHLPDCVVLDLNMAHMNGFAVQTRLAEAGIRLPVVVLTGHDTPEARERALSGGAACYLRKPADDQKLLDAIADAIAHARGEPRPTNGDDPA
jgi:FixJ family two-component response regulator